MSSSTCEQHLPQTVSSAMACWSSAVSVDSASWTLSWTVFLQRTSCEGPANQRRARKERGVYQKL
jgi:hypothetical protein